jgi:hypothetical protein
MFIAIFVVIGQTGRTVSKYKWSPPEVGILPMLHLLRSEVRPHTAVQLDIDLSGWHVPARRVNTREHKDDQATIDYYYVDPWLHGEVRLADGSRLRWQYRHHIRERQRTYQRISGQVRTKSKTRHFQVCTVKLRLRRRRYPHVHSAPQDGDATITQTQSDEHFRIKVRQKHAGAPEYLDVQPLVTGIAHAYRQIDISGDEPATPQPVQQQANVAPTPGATAGAVPQSTDHGLTIVAPDLQQGLLQAQARGAGVGAYISRHNGQLYLSLDFIHDTQERQQVQHLLQRYQAGETLDVETLSWLGRRLLGN